MAGMREIANKVGISVATVSRALRLDPVVNSKTQQAVLRAARELGYQRNAYVGEFMSSIRRSETANFKGNLGIIWGERLPEQGSDSRLRQIQLGAQEQAEKMGYRLSEFALANNEMETVTKILFSRGIQGVLIVVPSFSARKAYLRWDFGKFSSVCLGWGLLRPELHTVRFDYFQAIRLVLHRTRRVFGERIAAVWNARTDLRAHRSAQASFCAHHPAGFSHAKDLFLDVRDLQQSSIRSLFKRHRIDCLLIGTRVQLPDWLREDFPPSQTIIFRDPEEETVFGWIDTQNALLGAWGVELLSTKLSQHEVGIPKARQITLVPPIWMQGTSKTSRRE